MWKINRYIRYNYLEKECFIPDFGKSFWESLIENQICQSDKPIKLVYQGTALKTLSMTYGQSLNMYSFTSKGGDYSLAVRSVKKYCIHIPIFQTEHPLIFIIETPSNSLLDTINERVTVQDMDIITRLNSKLLYIMRHVKVMLSRHSC